MRILLIQHLPAEPDPVFLGRTLEGRFLVIWRQEVVGSADSLDGAIKLACKGPLHHTEFGLVPRFSPRLEDWKLCTGPDKPAPMRLPRRPPGGERDAPATTRLRSGSGAADGPARRERVPGKPREPG